MPRVIRLFGGSGRRNSVVAIENEKGKRPTDGDPVNSCCWLLVLHIRTRRTLTITVASSSLPVFFARSTVVDGAR